MPDEPAQSDETTAAADGKVDAPADAAGVVTVVGGASGAVAAK